MKDHLLRSSAKVKVIVRSLSFEGQGLGDTHNKKVLSDETAYESVTGFAVWTVLLL